MPKFTISGHKLTIGQGANNISTKVGKRTIKTNFSLSINGEERALDLHFKSWADIKNAHQIAQHGRTNVKSARKTIDRE